MNFRITGLAPDPFLSVFGVPDDELAARGIKRYRVDRHPGFPDRIEMKDVQVGQSVLLLNLDPMWEGGPIAIGISTTSRL
ncbi:hypothetical protein [Pseudomonas sp. JAI120]|uniref:hypothetical protein n=1 Tax=Pseudomonas sp. JAI120 TaxID=2723063 RepID=UPI0030EE3C6F